MNIVQPLFVEKLLQFTEGLVHRAKIKINGEYKYYDVFKVLYEEDTVRFYFYIEDETGIIEEAQVLTNTGDPLAIKKYGIEKDLDGLVLTFAFKINIEELNLGYIE